MRATIDPVPAPRTSAEQLLIALLPFLLGWRALALAMLHLFAFFSFRLKPIAALGACFLQDVLLWCVLYALLAGLARRRGAAARGLVIAACNGVALLHVADVRCRLVMLQPLTWRAIVTTAASARTMASSLSSFLGDRFWIYALVSLVAFDAVPLLARRSPSPTRLRRPVEAALTAALPVLVAALYGARQPYHAESNVFVAELLAMLRPAKSHAGTPARCDEEARPASTTRVRSSPLSGAARGRNVVLLIGETWGWSETSLGSPDRDLTPNLRALAAMGPVATRAHTQVAYSTKAIYGILTGRYASPGNEIAESAQPRVASLASILRDAGYHTAFLSAQFLSWDHTRDQYQAMGFDEVKDGADLAREARARGHEPSGNSWGLHDEALADGIVARLPADRPFLAVLYGTSTHHPYACPEPGLAGDEHGQERFRCALRRADAVLGQIVHQLEARGMLRDTVIAVVGDHGENFVDGRTRPRGCLLTEAELAVPLVLAAPGLTGAPHVDVPEARQIDLVPTLVDLLGLAPDAPVQGRSLLGGGPSPAAYLDGFGACDVTGLVAGDTKIVHDLETGETWSMHLAGGAEARRSKVAPGADAAVVTRLDACRSYNAAEVRRANP